MFKILNFKIKVFLTKLRYGKHSLEYVNLFKNNDLRSPFSPCVKDEFVFHIIFYLKKNERTHSIRELFVQYIIQGFI